MLWGTDCKLLLEAPGAADLVDQGEVAAEPPGRGPKTLEHNPLGEALRAGAKRHALPSSTPPAEQLRGLSANPRGLLPREQHH